MAEQRTAEELSKKEYNYFIAFGIDVDEKDVRVIEHNIRRKMNSIPFDKVSMRLVKLREDIFATMIDDAVYENGAYRKNAGGRMAEAKRAKDIKIREARGTQTASKQSNDYNEVEIYLRAVDADKTNLYEFLAIAQNSDAVVIENALKVKRAEISKERNLLKVQGMKVLCAKAEQILLVAENKKQYDDYLARKK